MRKLPCLFILIALFSSGLSSGQTITGHVFNSDTKESLAGVNIVDEKQNGTTTSADGSYELKLAPGPHTISFSFIGYKTEQKQIGISEGATVRLDVYLISALNELEMVVVSGSLYEKKLTEETVSIDVIKKDLISNTNSVNLSDAITKIPGVYMMDEQANFRGGTGFTYGAGSRVMLVVDDQILLAADRGDAKWNLIPMETVEQIEVIKGASSVLYGSSALNGVISVQTAWPTIKPKTTISVFQSIYDDPAFKPAIWQEHNPLITGIAFSHLHKYEKMDLVLGSNFVREESYLQGEHSYRGRLNWKTRFHPQNKNITYGVNGNLMLDDEGIYFLWEGADTGAYKPFGGPPDALTTTILNWKYAWVTVDPWLNYFDSHNNSHYFKMRFYNNHVSYSDSTGGNAYLVNFDYKFHREFKNEYVITAGATGYYFHVVDDQLQDHAGVFSGAYFQLDKKLFDRLNINIGAREEFYKLDSLDGVGVPVFKGGLNYQIGQLSFLRASFGQGYRFPSLVEKYASTNVGILHILPNPDLKAEYGWNAEIGLKKSLIVDEWRGYADIAVYLTEYYEMTEFNPVSFVGGINFQSLNNTRATIGGLEFTLNGEGKLFGNKFSCTAGYNYVYPADIQADSSNLKFSSFVNNFFKGFSAGSDDSVFLSSVLKYRFRHMVRVDAQYQIGKISFGTDISYFSLMENLDAIYLLFIPGIQDYRADHMEGDWIFDARVGYDITEHSRIQFLIKNIANRMYAVRPAKYDPPRNFTLQYKIEF